jgi:hypothetical protein
MATAVADTMVSRLVVLKTFHLERFLFNRGMA